MEQRGDAEPAVARRDPPQREEDRSDEARGVRQLLVPPDGGRPPEPEGMPVHGAPGGALPRRGAGGGGRRGGRGETAERERRGVAHEGSETVGRHRREKWESANVKNLAAVFLRMEFV